MKKLVILLAAFLGFGIAVSAQPKAVGARLEGFGALGFEASYEHYFGNPNFLEVDAGLDMTGDNVGFKATGTYNFVFAQPIWTPRGSWSWYAGPGFTLGAVSWESDDRSDNHDKTKAMFGFVGQVGLEYTFWFPLQISADIRPIIGIIDDDFYSDGFANGFIPTISVRYSF